MSDITEKRKCQYPGCITILNRWNTGEFCSSHEKPAEELERLKLAVTEQVKQDKIKENEVAE
ncbi:hypothetical protein ACFLYF_04555, partial [Chloroflexota bacterium]